MKEIGKLLQEARKEKGISLETVSKETKIPKRYLSSLEEGDFSPFPGEVYLKGAIRNYAEAIGLEPKEILSFYEISLKQKKNCEEKTEGKINEKGKESKKTNLVTKKRKSIPIAALIWIILLAVVVSGSIWYRYQQNRYKEAKLPYSNGSFWAEENGEDEPEEVIDKTIIEPVEQEEPSLTIIAQDEREIIYLLDGVKEKEIVISFSGLCWVRVEQDGSLVEEKTFTSGDTCRLGDSSETRIRFGNPPFAGAKVNGLEIDILSQLTRPINIVIRKE